MWVSPAIGARVYIDECALVIGRVTLGDDASVWPFAVARGDVNRDEGCDAVPTCRSQWLAPSCRQRA